MDERFGAPFGRGISLFRRCRSFAGLNEQEIQLISYDKLNPLALADLFVSMPFKTRHNGELNVKMYAHGNRSRNFPLKVRPYLYPYMTKKDQNH